MSIQEILKGTNIELRANLDILAKDYKEKTGRIVCRSCPSDIQYMILTLKNLYKMIQFKFKRHAAIYKNNPTDKTSISNATMTDEKAIEFLRTRPERIQLFSVYPSNWLALVNGEPEETEQEREGRLAAEAEAAAVGAEDLAINEDDLLKMSLKDLRALYPDIKATSIKAFVNKVLRR